MRAATDCPTAMTGRSPRKSSPTAPDIGSHIIVTCQMSQAYNATMDKFVGAAPGARTPTLFLSGDKQDFPSRTRIAHESPHRARQCRRASPKRWIIDH
jgi:hypothetical protein